MMDFDGVGGWGCRGLCVVVWLVGPSLWAPFPLTLALSHGGERGLLVVVWCCCIDKGCGGLVGGGRFETCAYGSRCKRGCRLLRSVCPSAGSWPWLFCAPPLSFGHFPRGAGEPGRPGHTPAFASLRVPFR